MISGEFYGWNFGLGTGGFGGLLVAGVIMAIMYYGLVYSIAEMSPALPHTGGAYSFARSAMGPWGGFLTGLAENMEYVITPAVVVGAMGLLMQEIVAGLFEIGGTFDADGRSPISPGGTASRSGGPSSTLIFVWINIIGIEATMRFTVGDHGALARRPGVLLHRRPRVREVRPGLLDEHPADGAGEDPRGRRRAVPAVRDRRHLQGPPVRDLVLPRDRGGPSRRGGVDGPAPRRPARHRSSGCTRW